MDCIETNQYKVYGPAPCTYTYSRGNLDSEEGRISSVQSSKGQGGVTRHVWSSTAVMLIEDVFHMDKDNQKEGGQGENNRGFLEKIKELEGNDQLSADDQKPVIKSSKTNTNTPKRKHFD